MAATVELASAASSGDNVAAIADWTGAISRNYLNAAGTGPMNGTDFPQIASVAAVASGGPYKITLTPSSDDTVSASSPQTFVVQANALIVKPTSATAL